MSEDSHSQARLPEMTGRESDERLFFPDAVAAAEGFLATINHLRPPHECEGTERRLLRHLAGNIKWNEAPPADPAWHRVVEQEIKYLENFDDSDEVSAISAGLGYLQEELDFEKERNLAQQNGSARPSLPNLEPA